MEDHAHQIILAPPDFQIFLWPCWYAWLWGKVQRANLTCDVIRNSLCLCSTSYSKIWILVADWSMPEPVLVTWQAFYKITTLPLMYTLLSFENMFKNSFNMQGRRKDRKICGAQISLLTLFCSKWWTCKPPALLHFFQGFLLPRCSSFCTIVKLKKKMFKNYKNVFFLF